MASVTTSNEAWGRNPHAPFGFAAARGRLRRCRSLEMFRIAVVAAPCIRPRGAANATYAMTRTGSYISPRRIVLASASPRRAELLAMLGLVFGVTPVAIDETPRPAEPPVDLALRLARQKALAVAPTGDPALVIAADTIVVVAGRILGKPRDAAEARRFLSLLAGRTHEVLSGLAVRACPEEQVDAEVVESRVTFASLSREEIDWYASTGEGMDKAGAYALQGIGALFVTSVQGSYTNVIGLPLDRLYPHLRRWRLLP